MRQHCVLLFVLALVLSICSVAEKKNKNKKKGLVLLLLVLIVRLLLVLVLLRLVILPAPFQNQYISLRNPIVNRTHLSQGGPCPESIHVFIDSSRKQI